MPKKNEVTPIAAIEPDKYKLGFEGEEKVKDFLIDDGWQIVLRNIIPPEFTLSIFSPSTTKLLKEFHGTKFDFLAKRVKDGKEECAMHEVKTREKLYYPSGKPGFYLDLADYNYYAYWSHVIPFYFHHYVRSLGQLYAYYKIEETEEAKLEQDPEKKAQILGLEWNRAFILREHHFDPRSPFPDDRKPIWKEEQSPHVRNMDIPVFKGWKKR